MNNRYEIAQEFAEAINSDKIDTIILFGSVARGDDAEGSDIDLLIVSNYKNEIESEIDELAFEIVLDKQEVISPHITSKSKLDDIKNFSFMHNVRREGVVLI